MLSWLASLGLGTIAQQIAAAYRARQEAQTDEARIAADVRIKTLEAKRDVLVAESGNRINGIIRAAFALPVAVYFGKLFLWDKALGLGSTDPLSAELWHVSMVIIGFYFLHETVRTAFRRRA